MASVVLNDNFSLPLRYAGFRNDDGVICGESSLPEIVGESAGLAFVMRFRSRPSGLGDNEPEE
jgi:hypothetical protein